MSNMSDAFLISALMGGKQEKQKDPVSTYKKIKALLDEGKKDKEKKDEKKSTGVFELGMLFFACVPLLVPLLLWVQLSYIMRIAEILQHTTH